MERKRNKILVQFAHPTLHKSRLNIALVDAISGMENVTVQHLYDLYPDYYINSKKEQQLLLDHDIIVFQHPFYWYSAPSLMKEWMDIVLEHGFAYGRDGQALKGKKLVSAITTGGSVDAYEEGGRNHFTMREFLAPYEQTANLCQMKYLPPFIIHGSLILNEKDVENAAKNYQTIIASLRDNLFDEKEIMKQKYINHLLNEGT